MMRSPITRRAKIVMRLGAAEAVTIRVMASRPPYATPIQKLPFDVLRVLIRDTR
jgi:hypothetical protein